MKKIISFILIFCLMISSYGYCLAVENTSPSVIFATESEYLNFRKSTEEQFAMAYVSSGTQYTITYIETAEGTMIFEYVDGVLKYLASVATGEAFYRHATIADAVISDSDISNEIIWDTVDVEINHTDLTKRSDRTTRVIDRYIGHMHHRDSNGTLRSIKCNVREWYAHQYTMDIEGTWGSVAAFLADMIASLLIDASTATGFYQGLLVAGIITLMGDMINTATETVFYCNKVEQEIYGVSTTHPTTTQVGTLGKGMIAAGLDENNRYNEELKVSGYTTADWGSSYLGSQMFYLVYGMELIPTHWTE